MVQLKKDKTYNLVYLLVKVALFLPVATAIVKRAFSVMKFIKNSLHNIMGDELKKDCLDIN